MIEVVFTYRPTASVCSLAARFSFSAKERDTETGLSYFGARYYSSDLSLWLSVDPMCGKYPSLSPYTYCANNPMKLVDPNGKSIVIDWEGSQYRYNKDGTLTHIKGDALDGEKLDKFVNKAKSSLDRINKTSVGNRMISDLQDSETQYTIVFGESGFEKKGENTISWDSRGTKLPVQGTPFGEANATFDLAHELSHAFDAEHGWREQIDFDKLSNIEWVACYRENLIRAELGGPYRTHYGYFTRENIDGTYTFAGGRGASLLNADGLPYLPFKLSDYEKESN